MTKQKTFSIAILIFLVLYPPSLAGCQKSRRPSRYLIPEGYVGWVKVYFNVPDTPPLQLEEGRYLVKFPNTGRVETSSPNDYGVGPIDEFFYYSEDTRRKLEIARSDGTGMIWAEYNGQRFNSKNQITETYEGFFVGTERDYRDYGCLKDENGQSKTGWVDKQTVTKCHSQ